MNIFYNETINTDLVMNIINDLNIGIIILDLKLQILFMNDFSRNQLTMDVDLNKKISINDLFEGFDIVELLKKLGDDTQNDEYVLSYKKSINEKQHVFYSVSIKRMGEFLLIKIEDINSYISLKEEVEAKKNLQLLESEKLNSIGQVAANVIHEINTPNTYMRANMQLADIYLKQIEKSLEEINPIKEDKIYEEHIKIEKNIKELRQLISSSFRGTSRIMEKIKTIRNFMYKDNYRFINENIFNVLENVLLIMNNTIQKHSKIIVNNTLIENTWQGMFSDLEEIKLQIPVQQIEQLFMILINNSIDIFKENERKRIDNLIAIDFQIQEEYLIISYKNNGGEIPKNDRDKIFEPFYTTKSKGKGTGLGLYIAKEIITLCKGEINVLNLEDIDGVKFIIKLPTKRFA